MPVSEWFWDHERQFEVSKWRTCDLQTFSNAYVAKRYHGEVAAAMAVPKLVRQVARGERNHFDSGNVKHQGHCWVFGYCHW